MKEKASPSKRQRRSAKGTVLFTVVSVMMVLIVFLMGTLALAATANKRAQRNYQKEQTEYTARAVLDSVIQKINEDTTGTGLKRDIADGTVSSLTVTIDDGANPITQTVNITKLMDATNTNELTQGIYTTDGWKDVPLYQLSVNIASATTSAETTYSALVTAGVHTSTGGGGGGGGGGAFVSMGDVQTDIGTGGYVTGGSYVNVGSGKTDINSMKTFKIQGSGSTIIDAPLYVNGHMDPGDSADLYLHFTGADEFFAVMGNLSFTKEFYTKFYDWKNLGSSSYKSVPSIYIGGKFEVKGGATGLHIGSDDIPVNVFTGSFEIEGNNGHGTGIHGDLYAFEPDKTSTICSNAGTTDLYNWTKATITREGSTEAETFGNIFSAGNLVIDNRNGTLKVGGSVRCEKDVTINTNCEIAGDLVVGGKLTIASGVTVTCERILAGTIENNGTVTAASGYVYSNNGLTGSNQKIMSNNVASTETWYEFKMDNLNVSTNPNEAEADVTMIYHHSVNGVEQPTEKIFGPVTVKADTEANLKNKIRENKNNYLTFPNKYFEHDYDFDNNFSKDASNKIRESATRLPANVLVDSVAIATKYTKAIYPAEYEKSKMPDAVFSEPKAEDYTKNYITKLEELDKSIYDNGFKIPTVDFDTTGSNDFYTVSSNCRLTGYKNSKNIYINTTNPTITVVLDALTMNTSSGGPVIVVNDSKTKVTLVIVNECKINGIITENYIDIAYGSSKTKETVSVGNAFTQIPTIPQEVDTSVAAEKKYLPDVVVYGVEGSQLSVPDGANGFLTAQIRAPKMKYYHRLGAATQGIKYKLPNNTIMDYNGAITTYDGGKSKSVGVIGQLIADGIAVDSAAAWGMLYVHEKDNRCAACKSAGCTSCTGVNGGCSCTEPTCTCHTTSTPHTPAGSVDYAENFNVLFYNVY